MVAALALNPMATSAAETGSSNHLAIAARADLRSLWSPLSDSATAGLPFVSREGVSGFGDDFVVEVDDIAGDACPSEALDFFVSVTDETFFESGFFDDALDPFCDGVFVTDVDE